MKIYTAPAAGQVNYVPTVRKCEEGHIPAKEKRSRSTLPKDEARKRYARMGGLVVLEQIQKDSQLLGDKPIAVGPFARLDAEDVAAHDGKTRGAITNLFGSQAAFQAETMALALDASEWVARIKFPAPADFEDAEAWFDALLAGESARGPAHGAKPAVNDGFLWALWLGALPYGVWSEVVAKPSMAEYVQTVGRLEEAIEGALEHFGLAMREGTTRQRSRLRSGEPDRGSLAQPVPDQAPSLRPVRTGLDPVAPGRPHAVARRGGETQG